MGTGRDRPIVPKHYPRNVFYTLHQLSHPGVRETIKLIAEQFCWPGMNKDVRQWARSTDVFVQPDLRYSTNVFVRRDSHRRPFESAYEGPFKVLQRETKYYIIDKNGTNDSISINRLNAAYLEGNPIYVDFPSVQSNDTTPTLIIPQPTTNASDDTPNVSENKLKTTRSGRRVRFPEHLNDYCTLWKFLGRITVDEMYSVADIDLIEDRYYRDLPSSKHNLSFAGCGFLGLYHIGVCCCIKRFAPHLYQNKPVSGTSAGALAAACLVCDLDMVDVCVRHICKLIENTRRFTLGPFDPRYKISEYLKDGLSQLLPPDAHVLCSDRLSISLTCFTTRKNIIVRKYKNRDEVIQALLCSAYIPIFSGFVPLTFRGQVSHSLFYMITHVLRF
ncbi:unnamed protein product [Schistosoma curassoni]|uniref:PNPLA domain-containing protein n=1 Tax=Schistosoma curassoni TaxID=6186 RepID=A0A183KW97_9TREM|nr:unnamed protein product [Schistosoma curassoni]